MGTLIKIITILFLVIISFLAIAQQERHGTIKDLIQENQEQIEALAMYPEAIRNAILQVSTKPEVIVRMTAARNKANQQFLVLLEAVSESDQKLIWELSRYPALFTILGDETRSQRDLEELLIDYPKEIQAKALDVQRRHLLLVQDIVDLEAASEKKLQLILKQYPEEFKKAANLLTEHPEVLAILGDQIELVVLVGDLYQRDPSWVIRKADSIKLEISKRQAQELADWKAGLEEYPEALEEFQQVSEEFLAESKNEDYDPMYPDHANYQEPTMPEEGDYEAEDAHIYHHYQPYNYWFGFPRWYNWGHWYWYPYWYHWGYYYHDSRVIILSGVPSYYYISWYFSHPHHHYRYPHFSDYLIRHYQTGPRYSRGGFYTAVDEWRKREPISERIVNSTREQRVGSFRDYGRLEERFERSNNRYRSITKEQYLERNRNQYPSLHGQESKRIKTQPRSATDRPTRIKIDRPSRSGEYNRARDVHSRTWRKSDYNIKRDRRSISGTSTTQRLGTSVRKQKRSTSKRGRNN